MSSSAITVRRDHFGFWNIVIGAALSLVAYTLIVFVYIHANFVSIREAETRASARDKTDALTIQALSRIESKVDTIQAYLLNDKGK